MKIKYIGQFISMGIHHLVSWLVHDIEGANLSGPEKKKRVIGFLTEILRLGLGHKYEKFSPWLVPLLGSVVDIYVQHFTEHGSNTKFTNPSVVGD